MTKKTVNGGGIGGQIILVNGEKYRINPTKNHTSFGALPPLIYGLPRSIGDAAAKSKPPSEGIR